MRLPAKPTIPTRGEFYHESINSANNTKIKKNAPSPTHQCRSLTYCAAWQCRTLVFPESMHTPSRHRSVARRPTTDRSVLLARETDSLLRGGRRLYFRAHFAREPDFLCMLLEARPKSKVGPSQKPRCLIKYRFGRGQKNSCRPPRMHKQSEALLPTPPSPNSCRPAHF